MDCAKKYANDNGIEIIGDIPIYCALDSVESMDRITSYLNLTESAGR